MGYCFGGAVVLEMARSGQAEDVRGFATFHGGLDTPEDQSYSADTPPILIAHGGADTSIGMSDVATLAKELEAAGAPYEIEIYSGALMPSPSSAAIATRLAPTRNPGPLSTPCSTRCCNDGPTSKGTHFCKSRETPFCRIACRHPNLSTDHDSLERSSP